MKVVLLALNYDADTDVTITRRTLPELRETMIVLLGLLRRDCKYPKKATSQFCFRTEAG